jgi:hypothetical protein
MGSGHDEDESFDVDVHGQDRGGAGREKGRPVESGAAGRAVRVIGHRARK